MFKKVGKQMLADVPFAEALLIKFAIEVLAALKVVRYSEVIYKHDVSHRILNCFTQCPFTEVFDLLLCQP